MLLDTMRASSTLLGLGLCALSLGFTCPEEDVAATQCSGPKGCLYSDPDDCTRYIMCEINEDGITATPTVVDCQPGLQLNDNAKRCDNAEESTCNVNSGA